MSDWTPGGGWRKTAEKDIRLGDSAISYVAQVGEDPTWWVRDSPVPALPTTPYTVIRATLEDLSHDTVLVLHHDGCWHYPVDMTFWRPKDLQKWLTSFEVLTEPRAVTAKAVLQAVAEVWPLNNDTALLDIADTFGVES